MEPTAYQEFNCGLLCMSGAGSSRSAADKPTGMIGRYFFRSKVWNSLFANTWQIIQPHFNSISPAIGT